MSILPLIKKDEQSPLTLTKEKISTYDVSDPGLGSSFHSNLSTNFQYSDTSKYTDLFP